jgi:hypothetical protein
MQAHTDITVLSEGRILVQHILGAGSSSDCVSKAIFYTEEPEFRAALKSLGWTHPMEKL